MNLAKLIVHGEPDLPRDVFSALRFKRDFGAKVEALK